MSAYTIIADISHSLLEFLKYRMVPELIHNADNIMFAGPGDRKDASVCLSLYDIQEIRENMLSGRGGMINEGWNRQKFPPLYLDLFYSVTVCSSGDSKYRGINEAKILGKVLQLWREYPALDRKTLEPVNAQMKSDIHIELLTLKTAEKYEILGNQDNMRKAALFYHVFPVELESLRTVSVKRVQEINMLYDNK